MKLEHSGKSTESKPKPEPTVNFKNCSYVYVSLCTTVVHKIQHRTVPMIFALTLGKIIIA